MTRSSKEILVSVRLSVRYGEKPPVLREAELEIRQGEILGLVGQSGSGKSTLAMSMLGLLDIKRATTEGTIKFQDCDLLQLRDREWRATRGRRISLVLQSPLSSLNPVLKIRTQLKEAWHAHTQGSTAECDQKIAAALE